MTAADDQAAWLAALFNRSVIVVFGRWVDLPEWSAERARAEVRVARARQELDAYNDRVRRAAGRAGGVEGRAWWAW